MNEIQNKLPADPGAMILGIIALIISLIGCCCGILAIPTVIMSIIGLVWANKSVKAYKMAPDSYNPRSYSNVKSAKIVNIIALVLSVIGFVISLIWFGTAMLDPEGVFKKLENGDFKRQIDGFEDDGEVDEEIDTWKYEDAVDSTQVNQEVIEVEQVTDSI
ncbi:CCC motif membrane protein [Nonlabens marinus]|uniref:DUF4190 domain-containing protein n=1 Tax=Nonlabens marinus S1-08 TaxID=1454201 RepID=W8VUF9_9FLAO|nr:CCC motif membrane protein [Nonlabens marinus]BAO54563.1 hypothetical protein NMS_0554 [Nonlabens marinus S1-08]